MELSANQINIQAVMANQRSSYKLALFDAHRLNHLEVVTVVTFSVTGTLSSQFQYQI